MDILSNLPALRGINDPTLTLDFTVPGTLPSGVVFARASTATYFDSTGTMQTAATNAPRWDYDPVTLGLKGLLIEEARTNSARNSTMQGAIVGTPGTLPTGWLVSPNAGLTTSVVSLQTVNGMPTIDLRISGTTTSATYLLFFDLSIPASAAQIWTSSAWFAMTAGSLTNIVGSMLEVRFTGGSGQADLTMVPTPTLTRFSSTGTAGTGVTSTGIALWLNCNSGAAVDITFRIGAPQLELGAFATSLIPTTTVAVTRAQDSCAIPPANMGFFTPPGGTWMAEFIETMNAGKNNRIIGMNAGGTAQSPLFTNITTNTLGQYDSLGAVNTANTVTFGAVMRGASTYTPSTGQTCLNGGAVATGALTSGYAVLATNGVRFLADAGGLTPTTGYIRRVNYWTRVLSAAELQTVTGLPSADFDFTTPGVLPVGVTFVRPAPATYTDSAGVIRPSPIGTPRWDYDPITHVLLGLLIEDSRVNSLFPSANWGTTQAPSTSVDGITQNVGVSPSGAIDAIAFIPGTFSGVHQFYKIFAGALNTTYVYSVYLKAAGMNYVAVGLENSAFVPAQTATFNLATGTVDTQNSQATAAIQAVGGGWYRCSVIATSLASGTNAYVANIKPSPTGGGISVITGNSVDGVWAWGNQVEVGTYLTSLITTTTVAVTRWADVVNIPIANVAGFNPNAGSLVHQYISKGSILGYGAIAQFVGSNAATDYISVDETAATSSTPTNVRISGASLSVGGTSLSYTGLPGIVLAPPNVIRRGATSWAAGAYVASAHNGLAGQQTLGPAASMPVITTLQVGGLMHYQNPWSQWAQRIRYWPRQLPTSDLQALTIAPTLDLDFMNAGTLPPGVTYARASPATYFDATGTMQVSAMNLALQSGNLTIAPWSAASLVMTIGTDVAPNGSSMTRMAEDATTNVHYLNQAGLLTGANNVYTLSLYARAAQNRYLQVVLDDGTNGAWCNFDLVSGTVAFGPNDSIGGTNNPNNAASIAPVGNGVYRLRLTTSNPSTYSRAVLILVNSGTAGFAPSYAGNAANGLSVWGAQVELGSSATTYAPTTTAPNGAPRWDYDPVTKTLNGLLIEGPRTNYAPYSTGSGATWAVASSSLTANAFPAPNGTTTATQLTEDTSNGFHYCDNQGVSSIPVNAPVTTSIYIRANTRKFCEFHLYDSTSPGSFVKVPVDLTTGAIGSVAIAGAATAVSYDATSIGNGVAFEDNGNAISGSNHGDNLLVLSWQTCSMAHPILAMVPQTFISGAPRPRLASIPPATSPRPPLRWPALSIPCRCRLVHGSARQPARCRRSISIRVDLTPRPRMTSSG